MSHPHIASRVFHAPLLAAPSKAAAFVLGLGPRILGSGRIELAGFNGEAAGPSKRPFASLLDNRVPDEIRSGKRDAYRIVDGVAVIPVTGTLIHRGAWVGSNSGEMSYEGISAQIRAASEDSVARAIALEIDSHGGEVAGCFDLAAEIRAAREKKPVHAFVCDNAHSAAYALASQAARVIVPRAGSVGSIGVICMHADYSAQLEQMGVRVTVIAAGGRKGEGNPYEPLPESVRAGIQAEMETLRQIFAETVAEGRGARMSVEAILQTEAACFLGQDAVEAGLADEVASPKEAFESFASQFTWRRAAPSYQATKEGSQIMNENENQPGGAVSDTAAADTPAGAAAPQGASGAAPAAEAPQAAPAGAAAASPAGPSAADERKRISEILGSDEAQGRRALAESLAFNSSMTAGEARRHLAAAAKEGAAQSLSAQMNSEDGGDLDLPPPSGGKAENPVLAAHRKAKGK